MRKIFTTLMTLCLPLMMMAQGWPANYGGVMLQGFYWDSFDATQWNNLESQAEETAQYFDLIWVPQSGKCQGLSMGYDPLYWFDQNSSFGSEQQLRSMISKYKSLGTGIIADVVINHHKELSNWVVFPRETYQGVDYQILSTDICRDDDNGKTLEWATANGYELSPNNDFTGSGSYNWDGMRDLDHNSDNVKRTVVAYLNMLKNDLGYAGFRYDLVKGYLASFTAEYNNNVKPEFSVGECFDYSINTVKRWVNGTALDGVIQSAAFDFPLRDKLRTAANNGAWNNLAHQSKAGLVYQEGMNRYSVTMVENHDTERRSNNEQDPVKKDTLAANAFILAMPGTPCVFLKHWTDCKIDIANMIKIRKLAGITNQSETATFEATSQFIAQRTEGTRCSLLAVCGPAAASYTPTDRWKEIAGGYHWRYFVEGTAETAWISLPSGNYDGEQTTTLKAISQNPDAKIVYTLDGSTPTASSTMVASGTTITIPTGTTTLTAALLIGGTISGVVKCTYKVTAFEPYDITVYVNTDKVGWTNVCFWTWGGDGSHAPTNSSWPGDRITNIVNVNGKNWYAKTYHINSSDDFVNFVFSNNKTPQTVDITGINKDTFFEISTETIDGKHYVNIINPLKGDINGDGEVNTSDVTVLYNVIFGTDTDTDATTCDINGDGGTPNTSDVTALYNIIFGTAQ